MISINNKPTEPRRTLEIFFEGAPMTKSNMKAYSRRTRCYFIPRAWKAWEEGIATQFQFKAPKGFEMFLGPLEVHLEFFYLPKQRTDLSNAEKGLFDALNKLLWKDDRQVIRIVKEKKISKEMPGIKIKVMEL